MIALYIHMVSIEIDGRVESECAGCCGLGRFIEQVKPWHSGCKLDRLAEYVRSCVG